MNALKNIVGGLIESARADVVAEARSWIGTPYVEGATIKGGGCDCATFIMEVYRATGMIADEEVGYYGRHWYINASDEQYMFRVVRHAFKTVEGISYPSLKLNPGDIVLVRAAKSRLYNHGGIVTKWPLIVHALGEGVEEVNASQNPIWGFKQIAGFDPFAKKFGGT